MTTKENIIKIMNNLFSIDEQINSVNIKIKDLKIKRDSIELELMDILEKNKLENKKLILNNKELFINKCSTLPPLNIKIVKDILNNYLDNIKTTMIIKDIENYRNNNKKEKIKIKRKFSKKSLKKKNL